MAQQRDQSSLIEEAFNLYDRQGQGFIDPEMLGTVLRSIGKIPSEREIIGLVRKVNSENEGRVTLQLLRTIAGETRSQVTEDQIQAAYRVFDRDQKGYIDVKEFRHILTSVGERLTPDEVSRMLVNAKIGDDGRISPEQFISIMHGNY